MSEHVRSTRRPGLRRFISANRLSFAIVAMLLVLPIVWTSDYQRSILVRLFILSVLLIGLNLITGYGKMINLGHAGFYGLGAYVAGILSAKVGWPTVIAFLLAPIVTAGLSWLIGIPSLRLRGIYFAMATLGTGMVLFLLFGRAVGLTGGPNGLRGIPPLSLGPLVFDTSLSRYALAAFVLAFVFWTTRLLMASPYGQALRAAAVSEPAAVVSGVNIQRVRLMAFVISGAIAGLAGAVEAFNSRFVSPSSFDFFVAVTLLVGLTLGGSGTILGPIVGSAVLVFLAERLSNQPNLRLFIIGLVFLTVLQILPDGLVGLVTRLRRRWHKEIPHTEESGLRTASQGAASLSVTHQPVVGPTLVVDDVWKRYGGVEVLKGVTFSVESGRVLGLIGPNGAGKTTLANVISGFVDPDFGRVALGSIEMIPLPPHRRAESGLGRSFQNLQLFSGLSVVDNVLMGAYLRRDHGVLAGLLWGARRSAAEAEEKARALELLDSLGLSEYASDAVENLSFGRAKLVELARILAIDPQVVILDEPAAGLAGSATGPVRDLICALRDRGIGVLLIEHNVKLVMGVSDKVLVLDHGETLAHGTPEQVQADPKVIAAYLGQPLDAKRDRRMG